MSRYSACWYRTREVTLTAVAPCCPGWGRNESHHTARQLGKLCLLAPEKRRGVWTDVYYQVSFGEFDRGLHATVCAARCTCTYRV